MRWVVFRYGDTSWVLDGELWLWVILGVAIGGVLMLKLLFWARKRIPQIQNPGDVLVVYPQYLIEEYWGKPLKAERGWEDFDGWYYRCPLCPARFAFHLFRPHLEEYHTDYGRVTWELVGTE